MRLLVDGDGCPVVDPCVRICGEHSIPCVLLCDTAHRLERAGAETVVVDQGADSVDFTLVNLIRHGDLVVTQDYGLAAMALSRGAKVLDQNGMQYTDVNMDSLLLARHTARKLRQHGGRLKGPPKRSEEQNREFACALERLIREAQT